MKPRPVGVELFNVDGQTDGQAGRLTDGHNKNNSRLFEIFRKPLNNKKYSYLDIIWPNDKRNSVYDVTIRNKHAVPKYLSTILTRHTHLRNIQKFLSYFTENTPCLYYKEQGDDT
jgi:hypothetical protein